MVCGGCVNFDTKRKLDECWVLNSGQWHIFGRLRRPRYDARAVNLRRDSFWITGKPQENYYIEEIKQILVCLGGFVSNRKTQDSEIFNPISGKFDAGPRLPHVVGQHCMLKVNDTHYALIGGQ